MALEDDGLAEHGQGPGMARVGGHHGARRLARARVVADPGVDAREVDAGVGVAALRGRGQALDGFGELSLRGQQAVPGRPTPPGPSARCARRSPMSRAGLVGLADEDERLGQARPRAPIARVRLLEGEAQLLLRLVEAIHVAQQLAVVLAHGRAIGVELQGAAVGPGGRGEAPGAIGERGHRGLREGIARIRLRDRRRLRGRALERDVLRAQDDLHALVELHAVARVGQARLVELASASRSAHVAEALERAPPAPA